MNRDVSRAKAQLVVSDLFGPRAFCRKSTKTKVGLRKEIGLKGTVPPFRVHTVGEGETWLEAVIDAAYNLDLPDVVRTAEELQRMVVRGEVPSAPVEVTVGAPDAGAL